MSLIFPQKILEQHAVIVEALEKIKQAAEQL